MATIFWGKVMMKTRFRKFVIGSTIQFLKQRNRYLYQDFPFCPSQQYITLVSIGSQLSNRQNRLETSRTATSWRMIVRRSAAGEVIALTTVRLGAPAKFRILHNKSAMRLIINSGNLPIKKLDAVWIYAYSTYSFQVSGGLFQSQIIHFLLCKIWKRFSARYVLNLVLECACTHSCTVYTRVEVAWSVDVQCDTYQINIVSGLPKVAWTKSVFPRILWPWQNSLADVFW
jgi:hypothetical protein